MERILNLFRRKPTSPQSLPVEAVRTRGEGPEINEDDPLSDCPRYPPFDSGIPLKSVNLILLSQKDLIERIFRTSGLSREDFDRLVRVPIANLARFVHLLPATSSSHHCGSGGLFRFSLELGLFSYQSAQSSIFPIGSVTEMRHILHPRWCLATFLAALCSQAYRAINDMIVFTEDNRQWPPLLTPLFDWGTANNALNYHIRWLESSLHSGQGSSAFLMTSIVTPSVLQHLAAENNQVIPAMTSAVAGDTLRPADNPIYRIIAPTTTRVIEDDLKRSSRNYGHLSVGFHLEPHLIDAMRRLIKNGGWSYNCKNANVWIGCEGVFIDWARSCPDIVGNLLNERFVGVPKDPVTIADVMLKSNIIEAKERSTSPFWDIFQPVSYEAISNVVKLTQRELIFALGFDFSPYENVRLLLSGGAAKSSGKLESESNQRAPSKPQSESGSVDDTSAEDESQQGLLFAVEQSVRGEATSDDPQPTVPGEAIEPEVDSVGPKKTSQKPSKAEQRRDAGDSRKLIEQLKPENAWLVTEIINARNAGKNVGFIGKVPQGIAIDVDELNRHGQPIALLTNELLEKQWLWVDVTKPTRALHTVEANGFSGKALILKHDVARAMGLS